MTLSKLLHVMYNRHIFQGENALNISKICHEILFPGAVTKQSYQADKNMGHFPGGWHNRVWLKCEPSMYCLQYQRNRSILNIFQKFWSKPFKIYPSKSTLHNLWESKNIDRVFCGYWWVETYCLLFILFVYNSLSTTNNKKSFFLKWTLQNF